MKTDKLRHKNSKSSTLVNSKSAEAIALERLKTSKASAEESLDADGKDAGTQYVLHSAEYVELQRLARWHEKCGTDLFAVLSHMSFLSIAQVMCNKDGSERDVVEVMRETYGDDIDEPSWIWGFVRGAVTKFNELEPKLG